MMHSSIFLGSQKPGHADPHPGRGSQERESEQPGAGHAHAVRSAAWIAPASVAVLIVAIYGMMALAFANMRALPALASGSGH